MPLLGVFTRSESMEDPERPQVALPQRLPEREKRKITENVI